MEGSFGGVWHDAAVPERQPLTSVEARIDAVAHRLLAGAPTRGARARAVEFGVFVLKQAGRACSAPRSWSWCSRRSSGIPTTRVRAQRRLTIAAVLIQVAMVAGRLETLRELRVVVLFHIVGTVMELFKTDVGSWMYAADGILRLGGVPLYSGFMYAAVGSYMVRVYRLFDLRFSRYPAGGSPRWSPR